MISTHAHLINQIKIKENHISRPDHLKSGKLPGHLVTMTTVLLISLFLFSQSANAQENACAFYTTKPRAEFDARIDFAKVDVKWYPEWLERNNGEKVLPAPLPLLEKWQHPRFEPGLPYTMHEDSKSSDVSNFPGPIPSNVSIQYFHVLEKGAEFSGMAPAFNFVSEDTLVTLSFGRAHTHLVLVYLGDTMKLLDAVEVPGREHSALSLASKKKRMDIFRNTMGGAYSYLSKERYMYIPGVNNDILRIYVGAGKFDLNRVDYVNVSDQMQWGDLLDKELDPHKRVNHLTAIMPDKDAHLWFTSQQGIVGIVHPTDVTENGCPKVYARIITSFGLIEKLNYFKGTKYEDFSDLPDFITQIDHVTPEIREQFREYYNIKKSNFEQIQNSFAVGEDGVYIVTDLALYKLRFNEEKKDIELDPKWIPNFVGGGLMYENDFTVKPGHLNAGSGTSPTLMDNRFVAIVDNDTTNVNMCIFSQETGELIGKFPLFGDEGSAVENSIIAYKNSFIVANTFGYVDPFEENPTPGGMMRFDYDESSGKFYKKENWPAYDEPLDAKTATPKLSAANGMIYFYNRDMVGGPTPHDDWQLTTLDFRTGLKIFSIKPYFEEGGFNDNIKGVKVKMSLGKDQYDRKVFNNLWGTFCFGPNNSIFLGAYRGFIRFKSDAEMK
jgi:hypothetical protein